jgi:hypothetical protein
MGDRGGRRTRRDVFISRAPQNRGRDNCENENFGGSASGAELGINVKAQQIQKKSLEIFEPLEIMSRKAWLGRRKTSWLYGRFEP